MSAVTMDQANPRTAHKRDPRNALKTCTKQKNVYREDSSGFESIQSVIYESMRETEKIRQSKSEEASLFLDTVKDIHSVASETLESLRKWHDDQSKSLGDKETSSNRTNDLVKGISGILSVFGLVDSEQTRSTESSNALLEKDGDAVARANDIWKFAAMSKDNDDNTVGTSDTLQEENNQIRRLGSWGTVNTAGTNGTTDTGLDSFGAPQEINCQLEDDDGNMIDPVLLQRAQQTRKRTPRRRRLVKFDYPPIKSLRQCPRPDPADLPNLFFTEDELDQIEDDRYSTMSTDDIEIVAVAPASSDGQRKTIPLKLNTYKSPSTRTACHPSLIDSSPAVADIPDNREQPEAGWKQTRGRGSTPHRRRADEDAEEADFSTQQPKSSPSGGGRLVKGVQIYLRERSTGV